MSSNESAFIQTTAQRKIAKLRGRYRVIQGGTSASKTYSILPLLQSACLNQPKLRVSVVSESHPHLRRGAIRDFKNIMADTGQWRDEAWNATNSVYTFSNKSYIEFFSASDAAKLRGSRRDVLFLNEANNITLEAFTQLQMRTSKVVFLDFNPSIRFWAHEELQDHPRARWLTLTYKDNEATPPALIEEFKNWEEKAKTSEYWANHVRVYIYGQLGVLQSVVYQEWQQADRIPEGAKLKGYGLDFGYSADPTALVARYEHQGKTYYDEVIYQKGLQPADLVKLMKQREVGAAERIVADSADPQQIDFISDAGYKRIQKALKGKNSIQYGIGVVNQDAPFYVTSRSTNLIKELRKYTYERDKEGNLTNTPVDAFNHALDALRYERAYDSLRALSAGRASAGERQMTKRSAL